MGKPHYRYSWNEREWQEMVTLPEWAFWSDGRHRIEGAKFALRCAESLKDGLV